MPRKKNPLSKRVCVRHAGVETVRINCDTVDCMCFVRVPIREGKAGGAESHTWRGCMYVLDVLGKYAGTTGISIEAVLSLNR